MTVVRRLLAQRYAAVLLCAATLLLKMVVPSGYMIAADHGGVTIAPCSGVVAAPVKTAMPAMHHHMPGHDTSPDSGRTEMPCAFASLSAASLGAIEAVRVVAAIVIVLSSGRYPAGPSTILPRGHLRPPLRAPPGIL